MIFGGSITFFSEIRNCYNLDFPLPVIGSPYKFVMLIEFNDLSIPCRKLIYDYAFILGITLLFPPCVPRRVNHCLPHTSTDTVPKLSQTMGVFQKQVPFVFTSLSMRPFSRTLSQSCFLVIV